MKNFWPLSQNSFSLSFTSENEIESYFSNLFYPYQCLLFSSGRSALISALQSHGLRRGNLIWCEQFSSHCVQDAVGYVGNVSNAIEESDFHLLNHALGFEVKISSGPCIEDSVDSFFLDSKSCFPNSSSQYEIISLPKVLGTFTGAIVVCKDNQSYERLKASRMARHESKIIHNDYRRLFKTNSFKLEHTWSALEKNTASCSSFGIINIASHLNFFEKYKAIRLRNIKLCEAYIELPDTIKEGRLPSSIPIEFEKVSKEYQENYPQLIRNYSRLINGVPNYKKSFFLPVHHQIDSSWIDNFLKAGLAKKS